ncbi:hypothetical protein XENTR_v10005079 [Xenopus tropicalis]|nr:hypothetical protein XENTR_v10005079 [Xenopus tropicalis]
MSAFPRNLSATGKLFVCSILVWLGSPDYVLCDCAAETPWQYNITAEAATDTLLACFFPEHLLSGLPQESSAVVWTRNDTDYLVEMKLSGVPVRVRTISYFSVLLDLDVQPCLSSSSYQLS